MTGTFQLAYLQRRFVGLNETKCND